MGRNVREGLGAYQTFFRLDPIPSKFDLFALLEKRLVMLRTTPQALFLDRDGTLIRWVHYLCEPDKVELLPGVVEALRLAKSYGCLLFLHTNQSGVDRGYFEIEQVQACNERMTELIGLGSDLFAEVCIAPDDPAKLQDGTYRKPSPRFVDEMTEKYSLDRKRLVMIGDCPSDLDTGKNAGIASVRIRSDAYKGEFPDEAEAYDSLLDYARIAFGEEGESP